MLEVSPALLASICICILALHLNLSNASSAATLNDGIPVARDMTGPQLIGEYQNIPLPTFESSTPASIPSCPDYVKVGRVEFLQTDAATLYILPHTFISLLTEGGGASSCFGTPIDSPLTPESSTVLRRNDQISPLDTNDPLIAEFERFGEHYFLGLELGSRKCGLSELPSNSKSMWVAPNQVISVPIPPSQFIVKFSPGFKYVIYFDPVSPCVLYGNASEIGLVTAASSPSASTTSTTTMTPSVSPFPSASISPVPLPSSSLFPPSASTVQPLPISQVPQFQEQQRACFPASATALVYQDNVPGSKDATRDLHKVRLDKLRKGMHVYASRQHGDSCQVVGFTHQDPHVWSWMVQLHTENYTYKLEASPGHFIYVMRKTCEIGNGTCNSDTSIIRADSIQVGDYLLEAMSGVYRRIIEIGYSREQGLFNPQTTCGDISINGIVATTYTTAIRSVNTGHALIAPWRALVRLLYIISSLVTP